MSASGEKYSEWRVNNPAEYAGRYIHFITDSDPAVIKTAMITIQEFNARTLARRVATVYATFTSEAENGVELTTVIPSPQIRGSRFEAGPDYFGKFVKLLPAAHSKAPVKRGLLLDEGLFFVRNGD